MKQDDDERKSIVQQILQKGTDFVRRIIVPVKRQERAVTLPGVSSLSFGRPHLVVSKKHEKQCNCWCGACGCQHEWRHPNDRDSRDLPLCVVVCCLFACLLVCLFACLLVCLFACLLVVVNQVVVNQSSCVEMSSNQWATMAVRSERNVKRKSRVGWRVKYGWKSFSQKRSPSLLFETKTFVRGRIVAGTRQIFRQCHNLCQQNGPSWSELSSSGGVEAQVFLATS